MSEEPEVLTQRQAGEVAGVCISTIRNWIKSGKLVRMDVPGCRISRKALDDLMATDKAATPEPQAPPMKRPEKTV